MDEPSKNANYEGLLQNLRDFTIQIRDPKDLDNQAPPVGTGIVVSTDGKIITCAHVIESAICVSDIKDAIGRDVGIYFPRPESIGKKERLARVIACLSQSDDDIVLLQLIDGPAPLSPEKIAVLGSADNSIDHQFLSYGYSPVDNFPDLRAYGKIMGSVRGPLGESLREDPIQLSSQQIDHGMSGSAVLDKDTNLIVGLITASYFPEDWKKGDVAYAVNAKVLKPYPFLLPLRDEPLPRRPAHPRPKHDIGEDQISAAPMIKWAWNNAPDPLYYWVEREELLNALNTDWKDPQTHVVGLIGFGGEGKSSLARHWVDKLLENNSMVQPDGIFWWTFTSKYGIDDFLENAINYINIGKVNPGVYISPAAKVHRLIADIYDKRYLFVLDGLEEMQYQSGDQYGSMKSDFLRQFLEHLASSGHNSFCIITSRIPVDLDVVGYTTYIHRTVDRLTTAEGRALLRGLGVKGPNIYLDKAVEDWEGHALMLHLLGAYLTEHCNGDISHIDKVPFKKGTYEDKIQALLDFYDKGLTDSERTLLMKLSAYRAPVGTTPLSAILYNTNLSEDRQTVREFDAIFYKTAEKLGRYNLLRFSSQTNTYSMHPLIRSHYYQLLRESDIFKDVHNYLRDYYLNLYFEFIKKNPDDYSKSNVDNSIWAWYFDENLYFAAFYSLKNLIEAIHHSCSAGDFDKALWIYKNYICKEEVSLLQREFGAWDSELSLLLEFFPNGDISKEPLVKKEYKYDVLYNVGSCLLAVGDLNRALYLFSYFNYTSDGTIEGNIFAAKIYTALAQVLIQFGYLKSALESAKIALDLVKKNSYQIDPTNIERLGRKIWIHRILPNLISDDEFNATNIALRDASANIAENFVIYADILASLGWIYHLLGEETLASKMFTSAESKMLSEWPYLREVSGVLHADLLRYLGHNNYARVVSEANLYYCEAEQIPFGISLCHRIIGDLEADNGQSESARGFYDLALKEARLLPHTPALIQALLAYGRWAAKHLQDASIALGYLNEGLDYASSGGFRVYEADIRLGLAWAYLAAGDKKASENEASRAIQMSKEMGYNCGMAEAKDILEKLVESNGEKTY